MVLHKKSYPEHFQDLKSLVNAANSTGESVK